MAAYLGKISAVISANTQDFTRAMGTTRKELDDFEKNVKKKLQGFQLNLDVGSFDKTLTKLQLFRRTVEEAQRFRIDTSQIERMFEVFEDVGKPLIAVKNDIEGLSNAVQAELYPALGQVQAGFQNIQRAIKDGLTVSPDVIDNLLDCLSKLRASTAVVKDIEGMVTRLMPEVTGATFVQPHAVDELKRSANLRDRSSKMSADIRSNPVWQQTNVDVAEVATRINKTAAAVEKYKLELASANKWMAAATTEAERLSAAWLQVNAAEGLANEQGRLDVQLGQLRKINDATERRLRLEEETARQSKMFLSASGGAGDKLDPVLEGAASDIMTVRQFRGNFGADNVMGRLNVTKGIQTAEERINSLIRQRHEIEQDSLLTNEQMAVALDSNRQAIERETDALLRYVAAQSGGAFNEDQVLAAAKRRRKNTGSMGMGGFGNLDLAFQQAMFAVDDFMSATGDMEYKLRAISNNITQLGLMVGQSGIIKGLTATKGLFLGLAAVVGAELVIAIGRWASGTEKAKEKTQALNAALSSQQSTAEKLAQAYRALAAAIGDVGMSEARRKNLSREGSIQAARAAAQEVRESNAAASSPEIIAARVDRKAMEKKLEESTQGWFESDAEFRARRAKMAGGIAASKRIEDRMATKLSSQSMTNGEASWVVLGNQRRSGLFERSFDEALGKGATKRLGDELDSIGATGIAAGGRRDLVAAMSKQRDVLDREREKVMMQPNLDKTTRDRALSFIDEELGRLADAMGRFNDVVYADAQAIEGITRTLFKAGDQLDQAQESIARAFGGRNAASRVQADMNDLAEAMRQIEEMASEAAKRGEDPAAFRADADAAKKMASDLRLAANHVAQFADALSHATRTVDQDMSAMQGRADEQRRMALRMDGGVFAGRASQAQADADAARFRKQEIDDMMAGAIEGAEKDKFRAMMNRRVAEIDAQLAAPMGGIGENGVQGGTADERARLRAERRELVERNRQSLERDPAFVAARKAADEMTAEAERKAAADRGRILGLSPTQKAREEMEAKVADIGAQASELNGDAKFDFTKQAMSNLAKEVAPTLAQFGEEVRNAQLAGPNRAALNASDVTTMQGQSELQRLLRKDDPARDVNFVELQKQTTLLQELPQKLAEATGIVLDFK